MGMEMVVETITPQKAIEYLRKNTNNYRKLSMAKVSQYRAEIEAGRWVLNGEPIVFGEDGILKDGQHRLAAIAKSGKSIKVAVIRGVDKEVNLYDLGMTRTTTQIVNANGYEVNSTVMAAVSLLINQTSNALRGAVMEYAQNHYSELMRAYRACCFTDSTARKGSSVLASYLMLRTSEMPFYEVEVFFRTFGTYDTTGLDGYESSPAMIARKQFDERFKNKTGRMIQREQLEILVLALKDFHKKVKREKNYQVKQPFAYEEYLNKVRREDGIG